MIYLDNAATSGLKPQCVIDAVNFALKNLSANPGRSGHKAAAAAASAVESTRTAMKEFFGVGDGGNAVFCYNCTQALNYALLGLENLGHIVTTSLEHNSVLRPLHYLQSRGRAYITVVKPKNGAISASDIIREVNSNTVMIVLNHQSNVTGAEAPVREVGEFCRLRNIRLLVDAAQSAGHLDIDMTKDHIDLMAVAPHKGLLAAQGLGVLLIREGLNLSPIVFGGTGTASSRPYQPDTLPDSLESGTAATPAIAAVAAGIKYVKANKKVRAERMHRLSKRLYYGLRAIQNVIIYTPEKFCHNGVISFNIRSEHSTTVAELLDRHFDIAVRPGLHCAPMAHEYLGTLETGAVRASVSSDNTEADIDALIYAVKEIIKRLA